MKPQSAFGDLTTWFFTQPPSLLACTRNFRKHSASYYYSNAKHVGNHRQRHRDLMIGLKPSHSASYGIEKICSLRRFLSPGSAVAFLYEAKPRHWQDWLLILYPMMIGMGRLIQARNGSFTLLHESGRPLVHSQAHSIIRSLFTTTNGIGIMYDHLLSWIHVDLAIEIWSRSMQNHAVCWELYICPL